MSLHICNKSGLLIITRPNMFWDKLFSDKIEDIQEHIENFPEDIDRSVGENRTPLHYAIILEKIDIVDFLISAGASINKIINGNTAFCDACKYKINRDIIERFVAHTSEDESQQDYLNNTPLHYAAAYAQDVNIIHLLTPISNFDLHGWLGLTPLMCGCKFNKNAYIIRELVNFTSNINAQDDHGNTALIIACDNKNYAAIQILCKTSGINLYIQNNIGHSAYYYADATAQDIMNNTS